MFGKKPPLDSQPSNSSMNGLISVAGCDNVNRRGDVIFVHGIAGNAWDTWHWQKPNDKDYQKDNFWLNWLAEDLKEVEIEVGVWSFGYDAARLKTSGFAMPLFD